MTALRILMVADFRRDRNSGAAGTEVELGEEMARQGHRVETRWSDSLPHRIRHWNLYHLIEQPRAIAGLIECELAAATFDVLHVNQPAGWLAARRNAAQGRRSLFVHRSHGFEPRIGAVVRRWRRVYSAEDRRPWPRRMATALLSAWLTRNYRGIVRWADAHVVSCGECRDDLVARGVAEGAIHVSPQVPTRDFFDSPLVPLTTERLSRLLFVGQHRFFKAPMVAADVVARWLVSREDRRATWVCEEDAHEEVRGRFDAGLRERVELRPWLPRQELRAVFDEHGVFLFPSFTEGFGKVFAEAMARGLCVVATDQGGARDVISEGVSGRLAEVGDAEGLSRALIEVASNPDAAIAMGSRARDAVEGLTWPRVAASLAAFYEDRLALKIASEGGGQ